MARQLSDEKIAEIIKIRRRWIFRMQESFAFCTENHRFSCAKNFALKGGVLNPDKNSWRNFCA